MNNSKQNFYTIVIFDHKDEYFRKELAEHETQDEQKAERIAASVRDALTKKTQYVKVIKYTVNPSVHKTYDNNGEECNGIRVLTVEGTKMAIKQTPKNTVLYDPADPKTHDVYHVKAGQKVVILQHDMAPYTMFVDRVTTDKNGYITTYVFDSNGRNAGKVAKTLNGQNVYVFGKMMRDNHDHIVMASNVWEILV